jgi:transposase, IS5 family
LLLKPGRSRLLEKRDRELIETIWTVYSQQKWMHENKTHPCENRIVNIFQPHVRPIVRGKDKEKTKFGAKINIREVNGFCRIDRFSWDAYNESTDVTMQVENFKQT